MFQDETIKMAGELAFKYVQTAGICAQCVVAAVMDAADDGVISEELVQAATGLGGGIGRTSGEICGALSGAVLVLGAYLGRNYKAMKSGEASLASLDLSKVLLERFKAEYGGCSCLDVQKKILGEGYVLSDPQQAAKYKAAGGDSRECPLVCSNTAKWVVEMLKNTIDK